MISCAFGAVLIFSSAGTSGHRINEAFTSVVWNAQFKIVEVSHRLHLHDAAELLSTKDDLGLLKNRARIALYAADHFFFYVGTEELCELETLGAEIEGVYIYVYQECNMPERPKRIGFLPFFFADTIPHQVNHVNVELNGQVKSFTFVAGNLVRWLNL